MLNRLTVFLLMLLPLLPASGGEGAGGRYLLFEPAAVDIGEVSFTEGRVTVDFPFTNIAGKTVSIVDVHAQCGCTKASFSSVPVTPGKGGVVRVTLELKDLAGPQKRHLTVISTDGTIRRFSTITITGTVIRGDKP